MARYLAIWEADDLTMAADTTQRATRWGSLMDNVEQDMKQGAVKDFGFFAGAPNGFAIFEGTEAEVEQVIQHYGPLLSCTVYPLSSSKQAEPVIEPGVGAEDFALIRKRLKGQSFHGYGRFLKMR